ncbi:dihydroxyacetone kinase substrate-binding subunit DhaK [Arthrobacter globiformis NBRC 12137]|uniref:Dihydroxyacetone kinase substrate-binding subunit DhaK n=1 Tax=Arthrobacter globiformis (strain ATCC 8010 / DSM 20124 / JCM 1332 / NBRC 12137 / NCIMB 8907 / NRRL B-2979 / 168) TaxID=1077972 RepID=H0QPP2_ARTG1|nr:dihydroxyacetone kinase subunit DhaK [Arthrobacter globiformis]GAB14793.1 dihydroxyacetone kinase substrate-binding subunit DhaK [Arthrobacter globiformis NBRC 12137]
MSRFLNDPDNAVTETLEGFLLAHPELERRGTSRVVTSSTPPTGRVAVVTGGGSGHKPAFIGYIGDGMFDAVVCGDVFASPPVGSVLEAIRTVNTGHGVMLLLGNYSGDVMNFEMAADMARDEGIDVEMAVATDDLGAGSNVRPDQRRGVSGQFLIWKTVGAAARQGASLAELKQLALDVNSATRTMGVSLNGCTLPGSTKPTFSLDEGQMEVGVGHHGERGRSTEPLVQMDEIVDRLVDEIDQDLQLREGDRAAVVINGLGGTPMLELYIAYRRVAKVLQEKGVSIEVNFVGEYFTALGMHGFSVTLMRLNDRTLGLLKDPARTPHFTQTSTPN